MEAQVQGARRGRRPTAFEVTYPGEAQTQAQAESESSAHERGKRKADADAEHDARVCTVSSAGLSVAMCVCVCERGWMLMGCAGLCWVAAEEAELWAGAAAAVTPAAYISRYASPLSPSAQATWSCDPSDPSAPCAVAYYAPRADDEPETAHTLLAGEEPPDVPGDGDKPVRVLNDFALFDPAHAHALVPPALLEEPDGVPGRAFAGAGAAAPYFLNEEDAALEDDGLEGEGAWRPLRVRLDAVLRFTVDYTKADE